MPEPISGDAEARRLQALLQMGLDEPAPEPTPEAPVETAPAAAETAAPADEEPALLTQASMELTGASMGTRTTTFSLTVEQLAELFPEWEFQAPVSRGGFGTVYRAEHRQLQKPIAVKVLSFGLQKKAPAVARFEREIRAVGKLNHPGIVRAVDAGERAGVWYLAMEMVDGLDFGAICRNLGPLDVGDACELTRQAALALQHAHDRGLIHRDMKPGNLMLSAEEYGPPVVKVLDFGLAQISREKSRLLDVTMTGEFVGTVDYAAPEQVQDARSVDARVDVYGLGATLFRLLTNRAPHESGDGDETMFSRINRIMTEGAPSVATLRPGLPSELVKLVDGMLAREPSDRPNTPAEAAEILQRFCAGHNLPRLLEQARRGPAARRDAPSVAQENAQTFRTPDALRRRRIAGWLVALLALTAIAVAVVHALGGN